MKKWQTKMLKKFELGHTWKPIKNGEVGMFAGKPLKTCAYVRGNNFKQQMKYQKLKIRPPYDDFG